MHTPAGVLPPIERAPDAVTRGAHSVQTDKLSAKAVTPPLPSLHAAQPRVDYDPVKVQENLKAAIEHLNKQLASTGRTLGFSMDDTLNSPVVTVRSTQTGEVIRKIPSDAVIRVAHTFNELKGLLHDAVT